MVVAGKETGSFRSWQVKILTATWLSYAGYYFCRKAFYVVKSALSDSLALNAIDLASEMNFRQNCTSNSRA